MPKALSTGYESIRELVVRHLGSHRAPPDFLVITDTSDFFQVGYNDVVLLEGTPYLVTRYEKEGRFGLDEEPKFWVRRAVDLAGGTTRILKFEFHETFDARVGDMEVHCFRSPRKEARILELVADHPNFMHGFAAHDAKGNNVRILEYVPGRRFDDQVAEGDLLHEEYLHTLFPRLLDEFLELTEAILFLHLHGEKHGDIRRDHIIRDRETGRNRWIDFDYAYEQSESPFGYDLQGLGNILLFLAGKGDVTVQDLYHSNRQAFDSLYGEDLNIIFKNRVANLGKLYPYIPESLNLVLRHFSRGATIFYDHTEQFLADLRDARRDLPPAEVRP